MAYWQAGRSQPVAVQPVLSHVPSHVPGHVPRQSAVASSPTWYSPTSPQRSPGRPLTVGGTQSGVMHAVSSRYRVAANSPTATNSSVENASYVAPAASSANLSDSVDSLNRTWRSAIDGISTAPLETTLYTGSSGKRAASMSRQQGYSSVSTSATSWTPEATPPGGPPHNSSTVLRSSVVRAEERTLKVKSEVGSQLEPDQDLQPWSINRTLRLNSEKDKDKLISQMRLLDKDVVCSVGHAIDHLNRGSIQCPEGYCIVFSASSSAYYLLYRTEQKEAIVAKLCQSEDDVVTRGPTPQKSPKSSVQDAHSALMLQEAAQPQGTSQQTSQQQQQQQQQQQKQSQVSSQSPSQSHVPPPQNQNPQQVHSNLPSQTPSQQQLTLPTPPQTVAPTPQSSQPPSRAEPASTPDQSPTAGSSLSTSQRSPVASSRLCSKPISSPSKQLLGGTAKCDYAVPVSRKHTQRSLEMASSTADEGVGVQRSPPAVPSRFKCDGDAQTPSKRGSRSPSARTASRLLSSPHFSSARSATPSTLCGSLTVSSGGQQNQSHRSSREKERMAPDGSNVFTPRPRKSMVPSSAYHAQRGSRRPSLSSPSMEARFANQSAMSSPVCSPGPTTPDKSFSHCRPSTEQLEEPTPHASDTETNAAPSRQSSKPNTLNASSLNAASSSAPDPPKSVDVVEIGRHFFEFIEVIGRGAFGVVWRARKQGSSNEVAVKVVTAKDHAGFSAAAFEAELLQILTAGLHARSKGHVPEYFSHSTTRSSSGGGGVVRLAMSFVPGGALDKWLYGISDEEHKTVDVAQLVDGHMPGGQQGSWLLNDACAVVRDLLLQLAGVFDALQPIAFHRDVSSHNVLVHFPDTEKLRRPAFALIDFGLAVRSGSWNREWRTSNLAGDPRYWTPSAWMAFAFGFKYVMTHPNSGFQQQYLGRMDHFGLGVLGLETLFALWHTGEAYEGKHPGLLEVRAAWCKYWVAAIHLFQMFHRHGAQEVRQYLAQSQDEGVTCLVSHLRQLRQSLRAAAVHPSNVQSGATLLVLADLIDEKGTATWGEIPAMLHDDLVANADTPAPPEPQPPKANPRSALSLIDPVPVHRISHRRIRSTGGTLDSELRRVEPEIAQPRIQHPSQTWGCSACGPASLTIDNLSRSFSHMRHISGYT